MFCLANEEMIAQLKSLWKISFNDEDKYIDFFFSNRFKCDNCIVSIDENGEVQAALHLLPCSVGNIPAQYIYAAATNPNHRKKGLMSGLLNFADKIAQERNLEFSLLTPASGSLFDYYAKNLYESAFYVREIVFSRDEMYNLSSSDYEGKALSDEGIYNIRKNFGSKSSGFVNWNFNAVEYALGYHTLTGGKVVSVKDGYAMCYCNEGEVFVSEFIADEIFSANLISALLKEFPQNVFKFRLPAGNQFFENYGKIKPLAMAKSSDGTKIDFAEGESAYLGLPLD